MTFNQHSAYISFPTLTTHANEPQDLMGYWTTVHQMFSLSNLFIDSVNATVRIAICPPVVG